MPIHRIGHAVIFTLLFAWPAAPLPADAQVRTDANLITALDVSDFMMRHEERLEFEGLARAIVHPAVLDAIAGGRHGRIGFAVFTWSSGAHFEVLVPWTLIASLDDARRIAAHPARLHNRSLLLGARAQRFGRARPGARFADRISRTIDFGPRWRARRRTARAGS
jgi:hypothetical protein